MPQPHTHTLSAITIHITQKELEDLLINTAIHKSQGYKFAFMISDNYGGYKLTFVETK